MVWALVGVMAQPALALTSAPDQTWRTKATDKGFALARSGNTIFVGGKITQIHDETGAVVQSASALVAVDAASGQVIPSFDAQIAKASGSPEVRALAVSSDGATLYVGGKFDTVGGQPHKSFAAVDAITGAVLSTVNLTVSNVVKAILVGPDKVYLGGDFKKVNGRTRDYLAAMAFDGTLDAAWLPSAGDGGSGVGVSIHSLELAADGATVFVGGLFRTMNGSARMAVARVASDTGALNAWTIPAGTIDTGNQAWDLLVTPTRLFGGFGNGPNYVSAFRLDNGNTGSQAWKFNTVGNVQGLALHPNGTQMFVAGHFGTGSLQQTVCGNQNLRGFMLVHTADVAPPSGRVDCAWLPQITPFGSNFHGGWPLLMNGSQLWAGVKSKTISGVNQSGYARWTL
jgi:hypothetical protein